MNTKKKIAILSSFPASHVDETIPPTKGHYAVWLTALHEAFEHQDDLEIHWIVQYKGAKKARQIIKRGQHFHIIPTARKMVGVFSYYLYDSYHINKAISTIKPDLIHAWGTENSFGFAVRNFKGKKILSLQGILNAYKKLGEISQFANYQCFYERKTLKSFDYITAESPWAREKCAEINSTADYQIFEYSVETPFFEVERTISDQACCLYGGTDTPIKNIGLIIEAFSRPELSHIQLKLAGVSASKHPNLPSNIHALGRVSRSEMRNLLAETWCLVHPSLADCAPNIVNEARVMGIPVVLTENCGSKQHVVQGQSGYVFEPHDIENFIKYVLLTCESQNKSLEMGTYERESCRNKLSKDYMLNRITEIYKNLLNK